MKYLFLLSFFCCTFGEAISVETPEGANFNLSLSGYGPLKVGYIKKEIIPKFLPNLNTEKLVAFDNNRELIDEDLANDTIKFVTQGKKPSEASMSEDALLEKDNLKAKLIKLIQEAIKQPEELNTILHQLKKLLKNQQTINEPSQVINGLINIIIK